MKEGLAKALLFGDTKPTRFWLALVDFFFAAYLFSPQDLGVQLDYQLEAMPFMHSQLVWAVLLIIHGTSLLYGLSGNFNFITLLFEGILGWAIWFVIAITNGLAQGMPGPSVVMALSMTWVLIRYPTHWGHRYD